MKKGLLLLGAMLVLGGCSSSSSTSETTTETTTVYADSLELLDAFWAEMPDKPEVIGGFDTTITEGEPAAIDTQSENAALSFQIPERVLSESISAASVQHAFLANNFTAVVLQFSNGTDLEEIASQINEQASSAQWICSIPQKYIIAQYSDYILFVYGSDELTGDFMEGARRVESSLSVDYDEAVV